MPNIKRRRARRRKNSVGSKTASSFDVLALRKKLGGTSGRAISRAAMAKLLGVSPGSIYNWEKGSNAPTEKAVSALRTLSTRVDRGEVQVASRPGTAGEKRGAGGNSARSALTRNGPNGVNGLEGPTFYANDVVASRGESEGCLRFRLRLEGANVSVCNVLLPLGAFDSLRSGRS